MKKIFNFAIVALIALTTVSCEDFGKSIGDSLNKSLMPTIAQSLGTKDFATCDSIMQANGYTKSEKSTESYAEWSRENVGSIFRMTTSGLNNTQDIKVFCVTDFPVYKPNYAKLWLGTLQTITDAAHFSGTYSGSPMNDFEEFRKALGTEPADKERGAYASSYKGTSGTPGYVKCEVTFGWVPSTNSFGYLFNLDYCVKK